jgi:hypothetical protein
MDRLSRVEAADLLRHCLEEGSVDRGRHFMQELATEGLEFEDVLAVLVKSRGQG